MHLLLGPTIPPTALRFKRHQISQTTDSLHLAYGYLKGELVSARVRRRLVRLPAGTISVSEGARIDHFFIVRQGVVELSRATPEGRVVLSRGGAGAMFGLLAEVRRIPQYTTAVALPPVELYPLDFDDLIADPGGRDQPLGAVLEGLAADLRAAWEQVAELHGGVGAGRRPPGEKERGDPERSVFTVRVGRTARVLMP